jgi:hypothetical protein
MIRSGKFCEKCKKNMANNLSNAIDKPKKATVAEQPKKATSSENKMRFIGR